MNVNSLTPMSDQDNFSIQYLYNYQPDKFDNEEKYQSGGKLVDQILNSLN